MTQQRVAVSVVIPYYRAYDTVLRALDSIAQQSCLPHEVIIVDDCSGDGSLPALRTALQGYPALHVRVLESAVNAGPGAARNSGWLAAGQPYVAFIDADDSWHPRKLEIQHGWMEAHPDAVLSGHPSCQYGHGPQSLGLPQATAVSACRLLLSNAFSCRSIMLRRELDIMFEPHKRYMEDHGWLLQLVYSGYKVFRLDLPMAYTYKADYGASGLSSSLWRMEQGELDNYARLRRQGHISRPLFLLLAVYSLLKFVKRLLVSQTLNRILKTS